MPSQNTTYYALFSINQHTISTIVSPTGAGNITGGGTLNYNSTANLNATPINSNYEFFRWIENGQEVSLNPSYSFTVVEDKNLIAEFKVKVSVVINGAGSVTVNGQSGFMSSYFSQTQNLVMEASPQAGYEFIGWSGGSVSTSPTINVLVGITAKTYTANFSLVGASLFVNATEGGTLVGTSESGTCPEGEIVRLVANPLNGYHFLHWEGSYTGLLHEMNASTSYIVTLQDVLNGSITFTAVFERDYVWLNVYAVTNGQINGVGGSVRVNNGETKSVVNEWLLPEQEITITAYKNNGYKFVGWYTQVSGGVLINTESLYVFNLPITETNYYAVFQLSYWYEYRITPTGAGTEVVPYVINTENELAWLSYVTNTGLSFSNGIYVILNNNLDLSAYMWEPIGNGATLSSSSKWQGSFYGGGHIISGLLINKTQTQVAYSGLFGSLYGANAAIKNLGLEAVQITSNSSYNNYVGAFAGQCENAKIEGCYVKDATIITSNTNGYAYVGGMIGNNTNGNIKNCYIDVDITVNHITQNASYIGGVTGNNYGTNASVEAVYSLGMITVSGEASVYTGALVGYKSFGAMLQNSYYNNEVEEFPIIGANNANVYYSEGKSLSDLKQYVIYVNETSSWDFLEAWFMPNSETVNAGLPFLRGVGNLIVNTVVYGNGTITPSGQSVYFSGDEVRRYVISPDKNYEIETFFVNGVEQTSYRGTKYSVGYDLEDDIGSVLLEVAFKEQEKEPINPILLFLFISVPLLSFILVLRKVLKRPLNRRRILRGAKRKYKKNRNDFLNYRK